MSHFARLGAVIDFYEHLTPASVQELDRIYTKDVWFKDPFNEVTGLAPVRDIFTHMFTQVESPRFVVTHHLSDAEQGFMTWDFLFRLHRSPEIEQCIRGATHVRFAADGRICQHRDYWDAAEELYEKLPLLGSVMRWLKRAARR